DRCQQLLVRLLSGLQLQVNNGKLMVGGGRPGVDLDCVTELDNGFLVFARFRILLSAGKEGGFLFCGIPGARSQNQNCRYEADTIFPQSLIHKMITECLALWGRTSALGAKRLNVRYRDRTYPA